jgi:hypothetical protein
VHHHGQQHDLMTKRRQQSTNKGMERQKTALATINHRKSGMERHGQRQRQRSSSNLRDNNSIDIKVNGTKVNGTEEAPKESTFRKFGTKTKIEWCDRVLEKKRTTAAVALTAGVWFEQ